MRRDTSASTLTLWGLAGTLAFLCFRVEVWTRAELGIRIWDVGQGDGISIVFPDQTHWLVDTGGKLGARSVASYVLVPGMSTEGRLKVDRLILSHPDQDHAFGVLDLLARWKVRELWVHADFQSALVKPPLLEQIVQAAHQALVPVRWMRHRLEERIAGVSVTTLPVQAGHTANDRELVLWMEYAGCRLLFLGDSEKKAEAFVVSHLPAGVDLLKVAHHGSRTSSTAPLLAHTLAQLSVISVGKNRYGHPHPQVIEALHRTRTQILRTDRHGYVDLRVTKQGTLHCYSAAGMCGEFQCRKR